MGVRREKRSRDAGIFCKGICKGPRWRRSREGGEEGGVEAVPAPASLGHDKGDKDFWSRKSDR